MAYKSYSNLIKNASNDPKQAKKRVSKAQEQGKDVVSPSNPGYKNMAGKSSMSDGKKKKKDDDSERRKRDAVNRRMSNNMKSGQDQGYGPANRNQPPPNQKKDRRDRNRY